MTIQQSRLESLLAPRQVIGWDRGRPARNAPQARSLLASRIRFALRAPLRAGRPRSQPIT